MPKLRPRRAVMLAATSVAAALCSTSAADPQMQVGFLWHMHQPIYYPGENVIQTDAAGHFGYSVVDIHNQRLGPYTTWPRDAIQAGLSLPNLGAQVSFSGTLIDNLNTLAAAGVNGGQWNNWQGAYTQARNWNTVEGNPRLDLIGFNYAHALMPLLDIRDMRMQIELHKNIIQQTFGSNVPYSQGFFPAETAFSERMIPALAAEGINWTLVDNIHFDRATQNYPQNDSSGIYAPNRADQINDDPAANGGAWLQLNNLWAPSKVSAPFSYRPHNVQWVDPNTGSATKVVAIPAARYEGNEDGRGGFGALQYQTVMDQYRQYNTDPAHPMFVMLHHDGDNYGGGSDSYYHNNFQNMVNWAQGNANYNVTTVQDYLKKYPVAANDVIHVENGSWAGADNGGPQFDKWMGAPNASGWSPDRNSWAVLTAAKNRVFTADDISPYSSLSNIIKGTGTTTEKAWHYLVQSESSDYWYWDGTQPWDSNVTRGCNLAVQQADQVIAGFHGTEHTPPSVFVPQRDIWNPGATQFGTKEPSDFKVWTYAYDVSGLSSVALKYRLDLDGVDPLSSTQNETYAGGNEVGSWLSLSMISSDVTPPGNILTPNYRALQYAATIAGQSNKLIDYYVEAVDSNGNITRSDIQHVYVGNSTVNTTGDFTMDGTLDANVPEVAARNGMHLYAKYKNGKIYVATNATGTGNDHFIYLAKTPGAMRAANWAKAGQIAGWDAYLAAENDNTYCAWYDATGATDKAKGASGGVLEGTLDLMGEFGFIPSQLYLAVGVYPTADGAALLSNYQLPNSLDNDGNIQAAEYILIQLAKGWTNQGGGSWSGMANWADGIIPGGALSGPGAHADLLGAITAPSTITLNSAVTIGQLTFDNTNSYTLGGPGSIVMDVASGSASINVNQGTHTIAVATSFNDNTTATVASGADLILQSPIVLANGSTLTTTGGGTVEIASTVSNSAGSGFHVTGGTLKTSSDLNEAIVQIDAGTVAFDATQHLASLSIASGAKAYLSNGAGVRAIKTASLSITGQLEIGANGVIVDWTGASTLTSVRDAIANGKLTSLDAAADPVHRAIGYAEASAIGSPASFLSESIDGTSILIRYTVMGDANLDGRVNALDFNALATDFGRSEQFWFTGDFSDDGLVTTADFNALAGNFNGLLPSPTAALGAAVPEPCGCSLVILLLGSVTPRPFRWRRNGG